MRIAQVAPLAESVPPSLYGGTERVVSYLTEELIRQGHDVTLFASGDSVSRAKLIPICPQSLRLNPRCRDQIAYHLLMLEEVYRRVDDFDLIHFHIDYLHFPITRRENKPSLTTLHGRLDLHELPAIYKEYPEMPVVSISQAQRAMIPGAHWLGTVYHGLPESYYRLQENPKRYLLFLGRISPEKRLDRAIEIALAANRELKIAAKIDPEDRAYFHSIIEPLLDHPLIDFIGEVNGDPKRELIRNADALLFPIDWPEPFGLVMIEAMACGTPVIAWPHGSVPEIIQPGVNGFLVTSLMQALEALKNLPKISRRQCREIFETRFTAERMAKDYVEIYRSLLDRSLQKSA